MKLTKSFLIVASIWMLSACSSSGSSDNASTAAASTETLSLFPSPAIATVSLPTTLTPGGGTAPYAFVLMSGGGSLSPSSGISTVYTPPATAGTAEIMITDAIGTIGYFFVTIESPSTSPNPPIVTTGTTGLPCEGSFSGTAGTLYLVQDPSGYVGGYLLSTTGSYYPVSGTCSVTGTTGNISLTDWDFGTTFNGTVTVSGTSSSFSGTEVLEGVSQSWTASLASALTSQTITQSCEGTYSATINNVTGGLLYLFGDAYGNVAGALVLDGYNYPFAGTCIVDGSSTGVVTLTNMTTQSSYTGTVTVGSSISMSGNFTPVGGSLLPWTAVSQ